ncbi:MAG: hypothetical protein EZS28_044085, partial [Streblomastix strix]
YNIVAAKVMNECEIDLNELRTTINKIQGDQNPFVLKYLSEETFDHNAIILMDYANLQNLDMLIETKKDIPIQIIRAVMRQTLEGLSLIHEKGIIHGNIKGQNILLHCPTGSVRVIVKIADIGILQAHKQPVTQTKRENALTVTYMPPEVVIGNDEQNTASDDKIDVWSFGILLHQLVFHRFPFRSTNLNSILMFMFSKKLERPPKMKDDVLWDLLT